MITTLGESVTLVADPDVKRLKEPMSKGWRVLFLQTPVSEGIWTLGKIDLDIIEVAEFFESRQIFDTVTGLRYPTRITINKAEEVVFPQRVFHFDRIMEYLIVERSILPRGMG